MSVPVLDRRSRSAAISVAVGIALVLATPASARVSSHDAITTHAYLEAKLSERRALVESQAAGTKAIEALAGQLQSECADVLAGMPQGADGEPLNGSAFEVLEEVVFATFGAYERIAHPALARVDRRVRRLRWSNRRLTKLLRSLALEKDEQSALAQPPLCADLRFWVASGYMKSSPQSQLFHKEVARISSITKIEPEAGESGLHGIVDLNGLVAHRLKRYESPADRSLARKALRPERDLSGPHLQALLAASRKVNTALGLPPARIEEPNR